MSKNLKAAIRKRRLKTAGDDPSGIRSFMAESAEEAAEQVAERMLNELLADMRKMGMAELRKIAKTIKKGDKGDDGKPGKSIIGPRGPAGKSVRGPAGKTIIGPRGKEGKPGKDGREIATADLLKKLNKATGGIKITTIAGLDTYLKNLQRAIREKVGSGRGRKGGGGMTIDAGTNITLVRGSDGRWTISATGGSNMATELVTAVQSGSDATIDLTQLAHAFTSVQFVSLEGALLMPNGNSGLPTPTWNIAGSTVTVYNADANGIFLVQYNYA